MSITQVVRGAQPSVSDHGDKSKSRDLSAVEVGDQPHISKLVGCFLDHVDELTDTLGVKLAYVEMCARDHAAAIMLSQVICWHRPNRNGGTNLTVERPDGWWLRKSAVDWDRDCAMTPSQSRRAMTKLRKLGIIRTAIWRYQGAPTTHIQLLWDGFVAAYEQVPGTPPLDDLVLSICSEPTGDDLDLSRYSGRSGSGSEHLLTTDLSRCSAPSIYTESTSGDYVSLTPSAVVPPSRSITSVQDSQRLESDQLLDRSLIQSQQLLAKIQSILDHEQQNPEDPRQPWTEPPAAEPILPEQPMKVTSLGDLAKELRGSLLNQESPVKKFEELYREISKS
jgi:hypothetical protein